MLISCLTMSIMLTKIPSVTPTEDSMQSRIRATFSARFRCDCGHAWRETVGTAFIDLVPNTRVRYCPECSEPVRRRHANISYKRCA